MFRVFLIALFIFLGMLTMVQNHDSRAATKASETVPVIHTVQPGDSLWSLALKYGPPEQDPRETVWKIRQANRLQSVNLQVGDRIVIPVLN